jgi:hypothetical protein
VQVSQPGPGVAQLLPSFSASPAVSCACAATIYPMPQMGTYERAVGLRYNARRVERFERIHALKPAFLAWSRHTRRYSRATRLQRKHLSMHLQGHFQAWAATAKRLRRLHVSAAELLHAQTPNTADVVLCRDV